MKYLLNLIFFIGLTSLIYSCQIQEGTSTFAKQVNETIKSDFGNYWYNGTAELNSYSLQQSRYGEIREGDAVLVFVTEDFSREKQVKLDNPSRAGDDKVSILKLNSIRKFKTGIYDYSMMQSVFTPVQLKQFPNSLKSTMSSQEWCGHTFTQLNLEEKNYRVNQFSYFEEEGDIKINLKKVLLEDELLNRIRINPKSIPTGNIELIPGLFYSRLAHEDLKPRMARIRMEKGEAMNLIIEYTHFERTLIIRFEEKFPHKILSWTERNGSNSGGNSETRAVLKKSVQSAYWTQHDNDDLGLRDTLQLTY